MIKEKLMEAGLSDWEAYKAYIAYRQIMNRCLDEDLVDHFEMTRTYGKDRMDISVIPCLQCKHIIIKAAIDAARETDEREAGT